MAARTHKRSLQLAIWSLAGVTLLPGCAWPAAALAFLTTGGGSKDGALLLFPPGGSPAETAPTNVSFAVNPSYNEGDSVSLTPTIESGSAPLTFTITGGTLPAGLSLDPNTGTISGTIQAGAGVGSPYAVTITISNGAGSTTTLVNIVVSDPSNKNIVLTYNQGGNTTGPFRAGTVTITATLEVAPIGTPQIAIDQQGTNDITATNMTGAGTTWTYTYTVNPVDANNLDGNATVTVTGTPSVGVAYSAATNAVFVIDTTAPTASIGAPSAVIAKNADTVTYSVLYTGASTINLLTANISLNTTGTASCTVSVLNGTTATPTIQLTSCTGDGTVGVNVAAARASDAAGNTDLGAGPSATFIVDNTAPTINIGAPSATLAKNGDTVSYTVTYGGASTINLGNGNISLNTTGTASCSTITVLNGTTATPTVQLSSCTGDGTVSISVAAARASDSAGNTDPGAGPSATFTVDNTPPTVSIGAPSASLAKNGDTVNFGVTYTGASAINLLNANITVNTTGTASCSTVNVLNGTTATPTVQVSGCTGDGTITISVASGRSNDAAGNVDSGAGPSASFTVDNSPPTVGISAPSATDAKNGDTVSFTVTYTGATTINLLNANITVNTTGTAACSTVNVVNGATATPTVQLSGCTGDGTVSISVAAARSSDAAGNTDAGAGPSATFNVDNTAPTVNIAAPSASDAKNGDTVSYSITYGGASTINLASGNVTLNSTGTAACSTVNVVNGTTATPTVQLSGCTGDGTISITLAAARASDAAGNTDPGAGPSATFSVDNTAPTINIGAPSASVAKNGDTVSFGVTYGGATTVNLLSGNVTVNTTGTAACSTVNIVGGTTATPTVQVSGCTGDGTISVTVAAARGSDAAGNTDPGAGPSTTFTVDNTAPTINIGAPSATNAKNGDTVSFGVTYGGASSINLLAGDITLNTTGTAACSTVSVVNGTTATPTVQLSGCTGDGTITITVAAARASDAAGNTDPGAGPSASFNVDNTAPTINISTPSVSYAKNGDTTSYTVTYGGATTINLTSGNITLNKTGTADCSTVNVVNGTTATPTVQLSGCTGDGTVGITVAAARASDLAGNTDPGAGPSTIFNVDNTTPVISSVAPASSANVNNTLVSYTFSEICQSASITWTRTGGSADGSSPHVQALTGSELNAGAHTNVTLTNNPTLVDSAIYSISFNCTDRVGLVATSVTSTGVTFSDAPLSISSAETMDTDNDGKIDTYKIAFNKAVNDSTFPGYVLNSLGTVTSQWLVAGYTNVRLIHGTAVSFATDTANDSVIYVRFDESPTSCNASNQGGCDTGAKPDVTTTATPGLQDLATNVLAQVNTAAVTEADRANPVLVAAKSLGANSVDAIFSESMEQSTAENSPYYVLTGGVSISSATRDGSNFKIVHLVTSAQTGGTNYTLTVNTDVKDLANLNLNASANTATFAGLVKPVVSNIVSTNANTLVITFNEAIVAATAECTNLTNCALIYSNTSLPVISAVSTGGAGVNSATFTLTVNDMVEAQNYTTTVLENTATSVASGEQMGNINNSATFTGDGRPAPYVHGDTAAACGANAAKRVIVQYDQPVSATALTLTNYKITQCVSGTCATGTGAPNSNGAATVTNLGLNQYAVDFTDAFNTSGDQYRLTVSGVQDGTGNAVATPTNLSFQCGNDTTGPVLIDASVVSADNGSTLVMLTFSEALDPTTANTSSNYKYDTQAFGFNVNTAVIQTNPAQVLVTFAPGLANGGHQITVRNVLDLVTPTGNAILSNGINNVQPIIVNAPTGFSGGSVFQDPFGDGTTAGTLVIYDSKLYLGADAAAAKLFEVDYGLTTSRTIILDADGTPGAPLEDFLDFVSGSSGTIKGVDTLYAACVGGTSTPSMTGSACTSASGTEQLFIGALNITGNYISYWDTTNKSSVTTTFTFTEGINPDPGGGFAYRSTVFVVFKDYLWNHFGAEAGGGGRGGRICVNPAGCADGNAYRAGVRQRPQNFTRIGNNPGVSALSNGSRSGVTTSNYLNAINVLYEHDNDGAGANTSQLYMANGGIYTGQLGTTRVTDSDGGILRTKLAYSLKTSLPPDCSAWNTACDTYWEDITPGAITKWNNFVSIPLPENSAVTGAGNCGTGAIEFDCLLPWNIFVPATKAIPYMRTAPNGDLYMLRNACKSQQVCVNGATNITGFGGCEFRTQRQVCPSGSEVPQLWMLPMNCGTAAQCALAWKLVAEYGSTMLTGTVTISSSAATVTGSGTLFTSELAVGDLVTINGQTRRVSVITNNTTMTMIGNGNADSGGHTATRTSGKTNMQGNNAIGAGNTHATLLEFVGSYLYVGFDNKTSGANIWRTDMASVTTGNTPAEGAFSLVNVAGLDGTSTNQRIFSHVTVTDSGTDWLILTTRDGSNAMQLYRTANGQN